MAGGDLFVQLGTKPKSLGEYQQEADTQRSNALLNQLNTFKVQDAYQAQQDERTYRDLARGFGADQTANYNALMERGLYKQAQDLQKSALEARKAEANINQSNAAANSSNASAAKSRAEQFKTQLGFRMDIIQNGADPQTLMSGLQRAVQSGYMTQEEAQQSIADMPQDAAGFQQWREGQLMQGMDIAKRIEQQRLQAEAAERARHNKATENQSAAQLRQQMTIAQMNDARMRENAAIQRESAAALREDKAATKRTENVDKEVTKFSTNLQKEGIPDVEAALSSAEAIFGKYTDPKTGKVGDVPGVGRITNALPDWAVSDEGKDVRSSLAAVSNIVLSARSGAAVTDQELRRLARELQLSLGGDAAGMQKAYAKFRARFEAVKANLAAGVSDDVKQVYEERGGIKIQRGGAKPSSPAADPVAEALKKYGG